MDLRTYVYVDGFNLYYRALKDTPYKWLDLRALAEAILRSENRIEAIRYYTAHVSGKRDPEQPKRQRAYLNAVETIPGITIHYGTFLAKRVWRPVVNPRPGDPATALVHDSEEKGSDVNLASHLLFDGFRDLYDVAAVISKDTDLVEPIRIVSKELAKPGGVLCPDGDCPKGLRDVASFVRHVREKTLSVCQLPNPIVGKGGKQIRKPPQW